MSTKKKTSNEWPSFLSPSVLNVLRQDFKFETMTPVQSVVVPIFTQQHKDLVVEAITGSGKTLAFVVPILEILMKKNRTERLKKHQVGALIISPTRELAQQTYDVINIFLNSSHMQAESSHLKSILFVGGNNITSDIKEFVNNGAQIVVGTAGRLEDLLTRQNMTTSFRTYFKSLEVLILDEADRLLDMGFKESLEGILRMLPKQRRTGLFSATQTDEIDKLIRAGLRNPCNIQVKQKSTSQNESEKQKTPIGLKNFFMMVEPDDKFNKLVEFLKARKSQKHLIFMNTCACVQYFSGILKELIGDKKTEVLALHRKLNEKRTKVYEKFKKIDHGILVCTDIMARGIDIDDVDWVIQYDAPKEASSFVHRCGRTARSGREGNAIIYLLPNEDSYVDFLKINQHVPLQDFSSCQEAEKPKETENNTSAVKQVQDMACKEREIYEKGKQAFVSYIRAYTKHICTHIFRLKELDLTRLAQGFGLLHLPKMPELKRLNLEQAKFVEIETSTIPYKDKIREKKRQEELVEKKAQRFKSRVKSVQNLAWSNKTERKLKRKLKREKKVLVEKKRKNSHLDEADLKEIEQDFQLLKKFKRKKIADDKIGDEVNDEV